jgi:hypothetical protein
VYWALGLIYDLRAAYGPQSKGVGQWQLKHAMQDARRIRGKKVLWGYLRQVVLAPTQ